MHSRTSVRQGSKSNQSGESQNCTLAGGVICTANEAASALPFLHLMMCLYGYFILEKHRNCYCYYYYYCCIIITSRGSIMQDELIFYSVQ